MAISVQQKINAEYLAALRILNTLLSTGVLLLKQVLVYVTLKDRFISHIHQWQNFSRLTDDCALLSQPLENKNDQPHASSSARSVASGCSCNKSSRKMWLNPFHPSKHFESPGNPLIEPIYPTRHSTCKLVLQGFLCLHQGYLMPQLDWSQYIR